MGASRPVCASVETMVREHVQGYIQRLNHFPKCLPLWGLKVVQ
jgi:hypothetical protein